MTAAVDIRTARFRLRPLTVADATQTYLGWLRDPAAARYIDAAAGTTALADLRAYIQAREGRSDVLFLGIFESATGTHIGNIKFEPIDDGAGVAVMGILIGDPSWRGRGVAPEVLHATAEWLRTHRGIRQIALGVSASNTPAIRAYQAVGFVAQPSPFIPVRDMASLSMVWDLYGTLQRED